MTYIFKIFEKKLQRKRDFKNYTLNLNLKQKNKFEISRVSSLKKPIIYAENVQMHKTAFESALTEKNAEK